jgi:outer membrane protein TolC
VGGGVFDFYQAGFDASWEIDVFGGTRREVEAANADIAAAVEDQRDVLVTLLGDVARSYVELRGFQRQVAIAQENLRAQRETLS